MVPKKLLSMLSGMSKTDLSKNLEKASKLLSNTNEEELNKILNSKEVAEFIRHNSRPFIFSASITPSCVAAARKSLEIIKTEPERGKNLLEITNYMRKCLADRGIKYKGGLDYVFCNQS